MLQAPDVRVITDTLTTVSASVVVVDVTADIYLYPDTNSNILNNLEATLRADLAAAGGLGWDLARSWLISRMHPGRAVEPHPRRLTSSSADQAVSFWTISITLAGYDR